MLNDPTLSILQKPALDRNMLSISASKPTCAEQSRWMIHRAEQIDDAQRGEGSRLIMLRGEQIDDAQAVQ